MAPWEIWTYDFPVEGAHPCVIFSNAARLSHPAFERVNVLLCRTLRGLPQRELKATEILLDRADGLIGKRFVVSMHCIGFQNPACVSGEVWCAESGGDLFVSTCSKSSHFEF
jgi:hypothetical protein